jgi:voltage-dependent potassium channel beta subunit
MEYSKLGRSGLRVSRIAFGSWLTLGHVVDQKAADELVQRAVELGINLLDTADVYAAGNGEITLGKAIRGLRRESLVIASKCYFPMSDDPNDRGLSRKHIHESLHASLRRLGLDYLDLYQCHRLDPEVPIEETAMAMHDLIRQGKVLYWGVSYWPARAIVHAVQFCRAHGFHAPISNQPPYNLLKRDIEAEVMPIAAEHGVGQIVFSPLAQGVLSGKYGTGAPPPDSRAANDRTNRFIARYLTPEHLGQAKALQRVAEKIGATASQVALAWCLRRPEVASAIVGARTSAQLEENAAAASLSLPKDVVAELDLLFPGPSARDTAT